MGTVFQSAKEETMKPACLLRNACLVAAVGMGGMLLVLSEASGVVVCQSQKNKTIKLRPETCRKSEKELDKLKGVEDRLDRVEGLAGVQSPVACTMPEPVTESRFESEADLRTK